MNVINNVKIPLKIQNITKKNYKFVKSNVMELQIIYNVKVNVIMTIVIYTIRFIIQNVKMNVMIILYLLINLINKYLLRVAIITNINLYKIIIVFKHVLLNIN